LLRRLHAGTGGADESFRSPDSIHLKLQNYLRFDPKDGGMAMKAGAAVEQEIWNVLAHDVPRLHRVATAIRAGIDHAGVESEPDVGLDDIEAPRGPGSPRLHLIRERNRALVERKKAQMLKQAGALKCEVCAFDFAAVYGSIGDGFIECHHTMPLSEAVPGSPTRLSDLALVCANCHRMLHAGKPWRTVEQLRAIVEQQ